MTRILSTDPTPPSGGVGAPKPDVPTSGPAALGSPGGRWPNRRLAAVAAAVVATIVLLVWTVAFSPLLGVRQVRVVGASGAAADQVRAAAHVPGGRPLVRLDTAAITARVARVPAVASAHVDTSFPSTVTITVTLRVAVGYLRVDGGYRLMDRTGTQFQTIAAEPRGLPVLACRPARWPARPAPLSPPWLLRCPRQCGSRSPPSRLSTRQRSPSCSGTTG